MPWLKTGVPVINVGSVPSPVFAQDAGDSAENPPEPERWLPEWLDPLSELRNEQVEQPGFEVLNVGALNPIWPLPQGFQMRLGRPGDYFISGTYTSQGQRIGLIRIPNFGPPVPTATAIRTFETEIAFLQANTDGLVIDVTRNNGGDACYNEELQRRLIPHTMRGMAREVRATTRFLNSWFSALEAARRTNQPPHVIAQLERRYQDIEAAFRENRGRTGPLPICNESLDRLPADIVYTKPIMVLIDDFSISAADGFAAVLQDNKRALYFGWRTNGAGGTTGSFPVGIFSEGIASHTIAMHYRKDPVVTPDYPVTHYVENVGVRPDIPYDYMTVDNLLSGGRNFTDAFTAAIVEHIRMSR
jgi:C-terminal processing protease CtpA/Prc